MHNTNADPDEKMDNRAVKRWYMFRMAVQVLQKVYFNVYECEIAVWHTAVFWTGADVCYDSFFRALNFFHNFFNKSLHELSLPNIGISTKKKKKIV